jgi:SAM-dependent methyltransferase
MDLRTFKLPGNLEQTLLEHKKNNVPWYQPFIFSDQLMVGTGAAWNGLGKARQYICTSADSAEVKRIFLEENLRLGDWYSSLVAMITHCCPKAKCFVDIGCNVGHFLFELADRGLAGTGVDTWRDCYTVVSSITGTNFEYIQGRYRSDIHRIPELEGRKYDFLIASAITTHLTDPHYFLGYARGLSSLGMLVTTPVVPYEEPVFRHRITVGRRNRPLPERFEFLPSPSAMEMMLQSIYPHVYIRPYRSSDPKNTQKWGVWLCLTEPLGQSELAVHGLKSAADRIKQFGDASAGSCSIPNLKFGHPNNGK